MPRLATVVAGFMLVLAALSPSAPAPPPMQLAADHPPATSRAFTLFPTPTSDSFPQEVAPGLDGNIWFTEESANKIGEITPNGHITEFPVPRSNSSPDGITEGPDGRMWFTERSGNRISRISRTGGVKQYRLPSSDGLPTAIALGPDGNLWFTEWKAGKVGRITPHGVMTEFSVGGTPEGWALFRRPR